MSGTRRQEPNTDFARKLLCRRGALAALVSVSLLTVWCVSPHEALAQETPAGGDASAEVLLAEVETIQSAVAKIRGLDIKVPIKAGVKTRDQLRKTLEERIAEEIEPEEIEGEAAMMVRLGLMEPGIDFKALLLDLFTEQIAGYYDHESGELYLIAGMDPVSRRTAAAHEIFHAVQDQHFTLGSLQPPKEGLAGSRGNPDRAMARSALIEGDATVLMVDFQLMDAGIIKPGTSWVDSALLVATMRQQLDALTEMMVGGSPALGRSPAMVQKLLAFPYVEGLKFVSTVRRDANWAAIDAIYLDPPESTEQIMHPERYVERDEPTLVTAEVAELKRRANAPREVYETVMGEARLLIWLQEHLGAAANVADAAAGWDGDRLWILGGQGQEDIAAMVSVWDSEADAHEFGAALTAALVAQYPDASRENEHGEHGAMACLTTGGQRHVVEQWGTWVLYLGGLPTGLEPEDNAAIRRAIWSSRRTGTYPRTVTAGPRKDLPEVTPP